MPVVRELPKPYIFAYSGHTQLEVASSLFYCQPLVIVHALSIALDIAISQAITSYIKTERDLSLKYLTNVTKCYIIIIDDTG